MTPAEALSRLEEAGGRIEVLSNGKAEVVLPAGPVSGEETLLADLRANRQDACSRALAEGSSTPVSAGPAACRSCGCDQVHHVQRSRLLDFPRPRPHL